MKQLTVLLFTLMLCVSIQAQTPSGRALVSLLEPEGDICIQYKISPEVLIATAIILTKDGTKVTSHNYFQILGEAYTNPRESLEHLCQSMVSVSRSRASTTSDDIAYMSKTFGIRADEILMTMYRYNLLFKRV